MKKPDPRNRDPRLCSCGRPARGIRGMCGEMYDAMYKSGIIDE